MLTGAKLRRINDRPRRANRLPLLAIGGLSVALAALLYGPLAFPMLAPVALLAGILGAVSVHRAQRAGAITSLSYEGKLDEGTLARFSEVSGALEALASSERLWHLTGPAPRPPKAAPTPERGPARAGLLKTPGIRSDVPIWGLEAGGHTVFFFPEGALLHKDDRYEPLRYEQLEVGISTHPFYEKEAVPTDAKVAAEDSARSGRTVVLYTLLEVGLPGGRGVVRLLVSSRQAAARFASAFGVEARKSSRGWGQEQGQEHAEDRSERPEKGARGAGSARHEDPLDREAEARVASAYAVLGLTRGSSARQVGAAYRNLARAHHPDKVANESREIREDSERRMKEINAAYSELKLHR